MQDLNKNETSNSCLLFFTEASVASMEATPLSHRGRDRMVVGFTIRVITKLPNSEQSSNS